MLILWFQSLALPSSGTVHCNVTSGLSDSIIQHFLVYHLLWFTVTAQIDETLFKWAVGRFHRSDSLTQASSYFLSVKCCKPISFYGQNIIQPYSHTLPIICQKGENLPLMWGKKQQKIKKSTWIDLLNSTVSTGTFDLGRVDCIVSWEPEGH